MKQEEGLAVEFVRWRKPYLIRRAPAVQESLCGRGRRQYEALSVGTREQLSILVRLAFAVYLRERGYPAAVILDDALVYADDDRFERMQLALRKAAETVQILILTCRSRDWREFGAPIRRLADDKAREFEAA